MTNLSPNERKIWEEAYLLYETYRNMKGSPQEWTEFARDVSETGARYEGRDLELAQCLFLAVMDWFGDAQRRREEAARAEPEQMTMGAIPWT